MGPAELGAYNALLSGPRVVLQNCDHWSQSRDHSCPRQVHSEQLGLVKPLFTEGLPYAGQ